MDCEKCGAEVPEGAETCPECGEPVVAQDQSDAFFAADSEAPEGDAPESEGEAAEASAEGEEGLEPAEGAEGEGGEEGAEPSPLELGAEEPKKSRWWLWAAIGVVAALLIGVGGYFVWTSGILGPLVGNDPEHAAIRMLNAYAEYDAQGILDNATHSTLPPDGVTQFKKAAADAKTKAGGKTMMKDIKVTKVTYDPKDPNKATVTFTASVLTDPAKGTYESQPSQLQMVKQNGKWMVVLYQ